MSFSTVVPLVQSRMDFLFYFFFIWKNSHHARKVRYSVVACLASALSIRELYFLPSLEQGTLGHLPFKASGSFMKNKIPTILSFPQIISRSRKTCLVSDVWCFFFGFFQDFHWSYKADKASHCSCILESVMSSCRQATD